MNKSIDIIASIEFYSNENGGLSECFSRDWYGCPIKFEWEEESASYHDCRIYTNHVSQVCPGDILELGVKFIEFGSIKNKLAEGDQFYLWSMGYIGKGIVKKILTK